MRKAIVLLLIAALALTLAACASSSPSNAPSANAPATSTPPSTAPSTPANSTITVGFAQCKADESDWRIANTKSMQEALSIENGFNMILADSNNDAAKQINDVRGFIDADVDYIVIAAVNEDGWDSVLQDAKDKGIPVILVDRTVKASEDLYTCWVGADFYAEGVKATEWMKKHFGSNPVNVVNIQGQLGSGAQAGRTGALEDAVAANGWNLVAQQTATWELAVAKEIMQSWIQQYPEINCVYAENDGMADGAIQALEEAGIEVGGDNGVAIISFDANRKYLQMTLEGKINCNVECNPLLGPKVAEIINNLENGIQPEKKESIDEEAFYYDTIDQNTIDKRAY